MGIRFIFQNKIIKEIKWDEIIRVTSWQHENYWGVAIVRNKKILRFTTGWHCISKDDVVRAFKEILKYQPKYKFNVNDMAGWVKE